MKENLIEVAQYDGPGYRAQVYYEGWRVAFLNDDPSKYRRETIPYLERHNETDELFVLLEGVYALCRGRRRRRSRTDFDGRDGKTEDVQHQKGRLAQSCRK